jgi:hypothetical protein
MRGRHPSGPEYVDHLDGSAAAKQRLKVVLETLAGRCRVVEACARLGLSEPRFHQLRLELLQAALARLEPRPAGRPPRPAADAGPSAVWQARLAELEVELQASRAREAIALILPQVVQAQDGPPKKASGRRARKRRRPPPTTSG